MSEKEQNIEDKKEDITSDLNDFFDNFIKEGSIIEEREIVPKFKVKVRVLSTGELVAAEAIMSRSSAPSDVVAKVRGCSILSQAIVALNDNPIELPTYTEDECRRRRIILYKQLLKMPAIVIHKAYKFYVECVTKQNNLYTDFGETVNKIENF